MPAASSAARTSAPLAASVYNTNSDEWQAARMKRAAPVGEAGRGGDHVRGVARKRLVSSPDHGQAFAWFVPPGTRMRGVSVLAARDGLPSQEIAG